MTESLKDTLTKAKNNLSYEMRRGSQELRRISKLVSLEGLEIPTYHDLENVLAEITKIQGVSTQEFL